ncbi:hypothetical protein SRHO_G00180270 [Serrasalmus rhombeus]
MSEQKRKMDEVSVRTQTAHVLQLSSLQNVDPNAKEDTYTPLDPVSRSSDDVYNTLANVDPNVKDDTYTALDPVSRSSDDVYNTPAVSVSSETQFSQTKTVWVKILTPQAGVTD